MKMRKILVWFLVLVMMTSVFSPMTTTSQAKKKTIKVKKITLNHSTYKLQKGKTLKLKVKFNPKKTTQKKIIWKSSKKSVAKVSNKGVVKALKIGKATITATVKGTKKKATCKIQVVDKKVDTSGQNNSPTTSDAGGAKGDSGTKDEQNKEVVVNSISITPETMSICVGESQQLSVNFNPSNVSDKKVKWESSDETIATVSETGLVTTKKVGTVTITATTIKGNKKASATIQVKPVSVTGITIVTDKTEIKIGETAQLRAEIEPLNATNKNVIWSSSDDKIASVNETGLVTAKAIGTATITVTSEDNKTKQDFVVIIVPEVAVTGVIISPLACSLKPDEKLELTSTIVPENATNKKVQWSSSDTNVAVVTQEGVLTAVREGTADITVTTEDGNKQAVCKVTVEIPVTQIDLSQTELSMPAGETASLTASVKPENATNKKLIWESSDPTIATVDANGTVTSVKDGLADITVTTENGKVSATCKVKVGTLPKKVVLPEEKTINVEEEYTLTATVFPENATNKKVTWESSDEEVVTVDGDGKVKGLKKGTAIITVKTVEGNQSAQCKITVGAVTTVTSFSELQNVLTSDKKYDKITVNSQETGTAEIAAGNYPDVILAVNAPKATVVNHANFKRVEIQAISEDTWIEKATGNTIDVVAQNSHIQISDGASSKIEVYGDAENVQIENNGTISSLLLNAVVNISISGDNHNIVPVKAKVKDIVIDTSVPIDLNADEKIKLIVKPGAESQTTVSIPDASATPAIEGVGVIQITNEENGEIIDVVANNTGAITDDSGVEIKGTLTGIVKDSQGQPVNSAAVYAIPYTKEIDQNDLDAAIEAAEEQKECYSTSTNADGEYSLDLPYGNYAFVIKADGCNNYFQIVVVNQETVNNQTVTMTPLTEEKGNVEGILYDAFDASTVPAGIKLLLRNGADNVSGDVIAETVTDTAGKYIFSDLKPGYYTIQVTDDREVNEVYVRMSFNVAILPGVTIKENMTITKVVKDAQVRFVLTWGAEAPEVPRDLDSHLVGPTTNKNIKFHTYFADRKYYEGNVQYADLDVDDTTWEGPETTTIYKAVDGLYHFYIYNFTDQEEQKGTRLSSSQAMVKVFKGDQNIETYHVPAGEGTLWDVCTYDPATNKLEPVNKVYYHPGDSSNIGLDPIDIARGRLSDLVQQYECMDFGSELEAEVSEKIQGAKDLLETDTDYEVLIDYATQMENFFQKLLDSTCIDNIKGENIESYSVYRQGGYSPQDDDTRLAGYSVIRVYGYEPSCMDNISATCYSSDAVYTWGESDKEKYQKLLTVTNNKTKAVEKYYLYYEEYVPSFEPEKVTDGDNYISDWYVAESDESEEPDCLVVKGENETLANPVFTFSSDKVESVYESISGDSLYVGKLTVTYKDHTKVYNVKYVQAFRTLSLESISATDNILSNLAYEWHYDENTDSDYKIYKVSGLKETLENVQCEFDLEEDSYTIVADEGEYWNYRIDVIYKGHLQRIYLKYSKNTIENFLPTNGEYGEYNSLRSIVLIQDDETEQVRLTGSMNEITDWTALTFSGNYDGVTYQVETEADVPYLVILHGEEELARYPMYYEKDIQSFMYNRVVSDGDNYITSTYTDYSWDENNKRFEILKICGENETLGNPEVTFEEEDVEASYEAVSDSDKGIGKLTVTYKTQTKEYWVRYEQRIRDITLNNVTAQGSIFSKTTYSWKYDGNDNSYKVWTVTGTKETLDESVVFGLNIEPESCEVAADAESTLWNYIITLSYKGAEQKLYLDYHKNTTEDLLPTSGKYNDYYNSLQSIALVQEGKTEQVRLTGSMNEITDWTALTFSGKYDGVTYQVETEADVPYLVILHDEEELARYPMYYEKDIKNFLYLENVSDGDNYITSYYTDYYWDENDERYDTVEIYGENETLGNPEVTFEEGTETTYKAVSDSDKGIGKLTVTYMTQIKEYWVRYEQRIRDITINSVTAQESIFSKPTYSWKYDDEHDSYKVWTVTGTKEALDESVVFDLNIEPESCELSADDESTLWNYVVTLSYKGTEQKLYLDYCCDMAVPTSGKYDGGHSLYDIALIGDEGTEQVRLIGSKYEIEDWTTLTFRGNYDGVTYEVVVEEEVPYLSILLSGEELARYPMCYERNIESLLYYADISDGDNQIVDHSISYDYEDYEQFDTLTIEGRNQTLGSPKVAFFVEGAKAIYEAVSDSKKGVGKLTVTYKTQEKEYWVRYKQVTADAPEPLPDNYKKITLSEDTEYAGNSVDAVKYWEDGSVTFKASTKYGGGGLVWYLNLDKSKINLDKYEKIIFSVSAKYDSQVNPNNVPLCLELIKNEAPKNGIYGLETIPNYRTIKYFNSSTEFAFDLNSSDDVYGVMVKYNAWKPDDEEFVGGDVSITVNSITLVEKENTASPTATPLPDNYKKMTLSEDTEYARGGIDVDAGVTYGEDGSVTFSALTENSGGGLAWYLNKEKSKVNLDRYQKIIFNVSAKFDSAVNTDGVPLCLELIKNEVPESAIYNLETIPNYRTITKSNKPTEFALDLDSTEDIYGVMVKYNTWVHEGEEFAGEGVDITVNSITLVEKENYVSPTATPTSEPTVEPEPTAEPKPTVEPEPTAEPKPTAEPEPTETPVPDTAPAVYKVDLAKDARFEDSCCAEQSVEVTGATVTFGELQGIFYALPNTEQMQKSNYKHAYIIYSSTGNDLAVTFLNKDAGENGLVDPTETYGRQENELRVDAGSLAVSEEETTLHLTTEEGISTNGVQIFNRSEGAELSLKAILFSEKELSADEIASAIK